MVLPIKMLVFMKWSRKITKNCNNMRKVTTILNVV